LANMTRIESQQQQQQQQQRCSPKQHM
jgi:hypothetical protein